MDNKKGNLELVYHYKKNKITGKQIKTLKKELKQDES